jgi:hypothetical protein
MPNKNANTIDSIIPLPPLPHIMDISKIFTQNVHGLWRRAQDQDGKIIPNCKGDMTKLEHLIHCMQSDDIDAWLIQETWLEDDNFNTNIGGYHMFRTNSPVGSTGRDHLCCGVAVILSSQYFLAWKAAGSPLPITSNPTGPFTGRFIGIPFKFECCDHQGWKVKGQSLNIYLVSVYHPCHDIPHEEFIKTLNSLLQRMPQNSHTIMGADINAKLG